MQRQSFLLLLATSSSPASQPSSPTLPHCGLRRFWLGASGRAQGVPMRVSLVCGNLGDRWKLRNFDPDTVQAQLSSWLLKVQTMITDIAILLIKSGQGKMPKLQMESETMETKDLLMLVQSLERDPPPCYSCSSCGLLDVSGYHRIKQS